MTVQEEVRGSGRIGLVDHQPSSCKTLDLSSSKSSINKNSPLGGGEKSPPPSFLSKLQGGGAWSMPDSPTGDALALKLEKIEAQVKEWEEEKKEKDKDKERVRIDIETLRLATAVLEAGRDACQNSCVELESSIAYARGAGVGREEILLAGQRLEELRGAEAERAAMRHQALTHLEVSIIEVFMTIVFIPSIFPISYAVCSACLV